MTPRLLEYVKSAEKFVPHVYKDIAGFWTIGYGHRCQSDRKDVTVEEALKLLQDDLAVAEHAALHISPGLSGARLDAITDFCFNLGAAAYSTSTLHRLVNNKEWELAAQEIQHWNHYHKEGHLLVSEGLTQRRLVEAGWLRTG